jgi:hypothetical protein
MFSPRQYPPALPRMLAQKPRVTLARAREGKFRSSVQSLPGVAFLGGSQCAGGPFSRPPPPPAAPRFTRTSVAGPATRARTRLFRLRFSYFRDSANFELGEGVWRGGHRGPGNDRTFFPQRARVPCVRVHTAMSAHTYVRSGHATATALESTCAWTIIDVPGVGHDGRRMSVAAAPIVSAAMHASSS